eukprot:CAMPEP_0206368232 /NCGR_PEP_ID=MMETSP0294-20121207/4553_1 /ASSEMBLY_ACC=CAM_ASM_000327 /TAXON_ID=39354 /ORGANISM="Heterosigma akashiwo, Strain CCMP2393" /LENGTH=675 /DNA_ID=CAMNT_0053814705 /DNA_START=54 /DNA_END=2082 /DNA_ORIENTATION=+
MDFLELKSTLEQLNQEFAELQTRAAMAKEGIEESDAARMNFWLLTAAFNILLMQAGFALLEVGTVSAKNAKSILFKNIVDMCMGIIIWWLFGYAFSQGGLTNLATTDFAAIPADQAVFFFHSFTYSTTCATIISGGVAERISFTAYMAVAAVMVGIFYPFMAYWTWGDGGWLSELGFIDFAGSGAIHALGGIATYVSAYLLGPRLGRFRVDEKNGMIEVHEFKGHSPVLATLGVFILLFGWFSFNASSTLGSDLEHFLLSSRAAVNTILSAAAASLAGIAWRHKTSGVHDLEAVNNTLLCGAVAITGCCAYVEFWVAPLVGILSTVGYYIASQILLNFKVDDPLEAFAVHGGGGVLGVLVTGLFAHPAYLEEGAKVGLIYGGGLLGPQLMGLATILVWGGLVFGCVLYLINKVPVFALRAEKDAELLGLDFAYHDGFAYPDFNKVNEITAEEMKAAEKRVQARNAGKKEEVKKIADYTQVKKRKHHRHKNADGTSYTGSSYTGSSASVSMDKQHNLKGTLATFSAPGTPLGSPMPSPMPSPGPSPMPSPSGTPRTHLAGGYKERGGGEGQGHLNLSRLVPSFAHGGNRGGEKGGRSASAAVSSPPISPLSSSQQLIHPARHARQAHRPISSKCDEGTQQKPKWTWIVGRAAIRLKRIQNIITVMDACQPLTFCAP